MEKHGGVPQPFFPSSWFIQPFFPPSCFMLEGSPVLEWSLEDTPFVQAPSLNTRLYASHYPGATAKLCSTTGHCRRCPVHCSEKQPYVTECSTLLLSLERGTTRWDLRIPIRIEILQTIWALLAWEIQLSPQPWLVLGALPCPVFYKWLLKLPRAVFLENLPILKLGMSYLMTTSLFSLLDSSLELVHCLSHRTGFSYPFHFSQEHSFNSSLVTFGELLVSGFVCFLSLFTLLETLQ